MDAALQYSRHAGRNPNGRAGGGSRIEDGSVGFQIGASETDVVLLIMNDGGMKHLMSDKVTAEW